MLSSDTQYDNRIVDELLYVLNDVSLMLVIQVKWIKRIIL